MSLYLFLEICAIIIPVIFSFDKNLQFRKNWKSVILSFSIVAAFYISGDIYFAKNGIWGFNPNYHAGLVICGLPIEEWLFFFAIPYASIFLHYSLEFVFPKIRLSNKITLIISLIAIAVLVIATIMNLGKTYTVFNFITLIFAIIIAQFSKARILNRFYISFLVILVPFFITNSILTGTFIEKEVVWYNNAEIIGIRILTVPIEDIGYAFSMLVLNLVLMSVFQKIFKQRSNLPDGYEI